MRTGHIFVFSALFRSARTVPVNIYQQFPFELFIFTVMITLRLKRFPSLTSSVPNATSRSLFSALSHRVVGRTSVASIKVSHWRSGQIESL
jgi:hypothetical protein